MNSNLNNKAKFFAAMIVLAIVGVATFNLFKKSEREPKLAVSSDSIQVREVTKGPVPATETATVSQEVVEAPPVEPIHIHRISHRKKTVARFLASDETITKISNAPESAQASESDEIHFSLTPGFSMTSIRSTDVATNTAATLASNVSFSLLARYFQNWSESVKTFIGFNLNHVAFEEPTDNTKTFSNRSQFLTGLSIGAEVKVSDSLLISPRVQYEKILFARALSSNNITLDAISSPEVGAEIRLKLFEKNHYALGISGAFDYIIPGSTDGYSINGGTRVGGAVYFRDTSFRKSSGGFETSVAVYSRSQNTSIVNESQTDVMVSVRLNF